MMRIALTTDHTGYEQLKQLKSYLESLGHNCQDLGPKSLDLTDDYPAFMFAAAKAVASGDCERGIILGGSGQGEAVAANRFQKVRCIVFYGPILPKVPVDAEGHTSTDPYEIIKLSREHNDSNMLSLGARFLSLEEMQTAVKLWLETPASDEARHKRRVEQLGQEGSA